MSYSLAVTGARAESPFDKEPITLSDANATPGGMAQAMRYGTQILCKNPDGSQSYYTLDAERSTPSVPVLLKV